MQLAASFSQRDSFGKILSITHIFLGFKRAIGSVDIVVADFNPPNNERISFEFRRNGAYNPFFSIHYMFRSYGTRTKGLNLEPVNEFTGYKMSRADGSMRFQQTCSEGMPLAWVMDRV